RHFARCNRGSLANSAAGPPSFNAPILVRRGFIIAPWWGRSRRPAQPTSSAAASRLRVVSVLSSVTDRGVGPPAPPDAPSVPAFRRAQCGRRAVVGARPIPRPHIGGVSASSDDARDNAGRQQRQSHAALEAADETRTTARTGCQSPPVGSCANWERTFGSGSRPTY